MIQSIELGGNFPVNYLGPRRIRRALVIVLLPASEPANLVSGVVDDPLSPFCFGTFIFPFPFEPVTPFKYKRQPGRWPNAFSHRLRQSHLADGACSWLGCRRRGSSQSPLQIDTYISIEKVWDQAARRPDRGCSDRPITAWRNWKPTSIPLRSGADRRSPDNVPAACVFGGSSWPSCPSNAGGCGRDQFELDCHASLRRPPWCSRFSFFARRRPHALFFCRSNIAGRCRVQRTAKCPY